MPRPKLTTAGYAERFAAEVARQQRRFCDAFGQWRSCDRKRCRRDRACRGDPHACLGEALAVVPRDRQRRAQRDILAATPATVGGPERAVRLCVPDDFFDGSADGRAIAEMKRLRSTGKLVESGHNAHTLRLRLVDA
jgi:hypothetical protein